MIGIIGIAAILALSSGVNNYIDQIQYDTMSSYTITVSRTTVDLNAMLAAGGMGGLGGSSGSGSSSSSGGSTSQDMTKVHADYSDIKQSEAVANSIKSNNLNDFKKYLDNPNSDIRQYLGENGVVYSYDVNFSVLATNPDGGLIDADADADALSAGSVNGGSGSSGERERCAQCSSWRNGRYGRRVCWRRGKQIWCIWWHGLDNVGDDRLIQQFER